MKAQIIVLYAGQYSMTDERTGTINEGTSVSYYFNTDLSAVDNTDGTKGMRPAKSTCEFLLMGKIKKAPALYEAEFDMKIGSDGKPVLKIMDLELKEEIRMLPLSMLATAGKEPVKETASTGR